MTGAARRVRDSLARLPSVQANQWHTETTANCTALATPSNLVHTLRRTCEVVLWQHSAHHLVEDDLGVATRIG